VRATAAVVAAGCAVTLGLAAVRHAWSTPDGGSGSGEVGDQAAFSTAGLAAEPRASSPTPRTPPARVCGSKGLRGPSSRPAGARRVTPSQHLPAVVDRSRRGTTFWLAPGTYHLGNGAYDQVRPKRGDVFIGAPGAVIDGQHRNLYAFAGQATRVTVAHLTIQNFGHKGSTFDQGVVNHDAAHGWKVLHNTVRHNAGAGVFIGSWNAVNHNCLLENGQYGFSVFSEHGVHHIALRHNEIAGNNTDNWEKRSEGCGCTGGGKLWATRGAVLARNWVHGNHGPGLWADTNNTGFLVEGNYISGNADVGLFYEISYNAAIVHNTFVRNGLVAGPRNTGFPTPALYLSESGSDHRAGATYGGTFLVARNRFVDNWSGVVAWENADRFAGSPANSSTGDTTLVNPRVATVKACGTPAKIRTRPYINDCRWKTRNLRVQHNTFSFNPSHIGSRCTAQGGCGFVGLFSNWGSYPSWSPYKARLVENHITFSQNNRWSHNTYLGPWRFMVRELGHRVSWKTWRSAHYGQDPGSTIR
jgi:hypothetical protein